MTKLNNRAIERIVELLEKGEDLPLDYKQVLFPPEKKEYELVYAGKEREEDILADTMAVPLQPIKTFGKNGGWTNKLIFGDNLQVMKSLLDDPEVKGRVKLIYIDPPFATKHEFRGSQDQKAYQDKIVGAKFIEFLRKRLIFLKGLLSDDGSIYIHLDQKKGHYIKTILDEIFGEQNFKNEIVWKRTSAHSDSAKFGNNIDYIYYYTKGKDYIWNQEYESYSEKYLLRFKNVESDGRRWQDGPITAKGLSGGGYKYTYKGVSGLWRCPLSTMKELDREKKLYFTKNGGIRVKRYLDENKGIPLQSLWTDIYVTNSQAVERVNYPTQKPESLIERIIKVSSRKDDLILDAFAGSGTTLAVAEKLGRRWIGVDCGKLAIYTMQKRQLNLKSEIGNKGKSLKPKPFTLYHAGLYDFSKLKQLPWEEWRRFALLLFNCRDQKHTVYGIELDGFKGRSDVLVFDYQKEGGVVLDYGFIDDVHSMIGSKVGRQFFIIAPAASVTFLEDYIVKGSVRYYILRIPYSIINELHARDFEAIKQPIDESQVNDTVDAVGFDFIRQPKVECTYSIEKPKGQSPEYATIKINTFKSEAMLKGASQLANRESLSTIMIDFSYDSEVFNLDKVYYASEIEKNGWKVNLLVKDLKEQIMIIYLDIYGNEYREIKSLKDFSGVKQARKGGK
ncbi:MAG: site-specific DNA-methyltransferase [Candidatus Omnitrophota bacterium]